MSAPMGAPRHSRLKSRHIHARILAALTMAAALVVILFASRSSRRVQADVPMMRLGLGTSVAAPIINARFGGKVAGRVLLDTGSEGSLISQRVVSLLRLQTRGAGDPTDYPSIIVPSIAIGNVVLARVPCVAAPERELVYDGVPLDGVLGMDFLARTAVRFDFAHGRVSIWAPGELSESFISQLGLTSSSRLKVRDVVPRMRLSLNGWALTAILDTGSDGNLSVAERAGGLVDTADGRWVTVKGHGVRTLCRIGEAKLVDIEGLGVLRDVPTVVLRDPSPDNRRVNPQTSPDRQGGVRAGMGADADAYVGIGALSKCDILLDTAAGRINIQSAALSGVSPRLGSPVATHPMKGNAAGVLEGAIEALGPACIPGACAPATREWTGTLAGGRGQTWRVDLAFNGKAALAHFQSGVYDQTTYSNGSAGWVAQSGITYDSPGGSPVVQNMTIADFSDLFAARRDHWPIQYRAVPSQGLNLEVLTPSRRRLSYLLDPNSLLPIAFSSRPAASPTPSSLSERYRFERGVGTGNELIEVDEFVEARLASRCILRRRGPPPTGDLSRRPEVSTIRSAVSVPFDSSKAPLVWVSVNRSRPRAFLLDTGLLGLRMSKRLARELRLDARPCVWDPASPGAETLPMAVIDSIAVGPAEIRSTTAVILDPPAQYTRAGIAGELGSWFLGHFSIELNYPRAMLTLLPQDRRLQGKIHFAFDDWGGQIWTTGRIGQQSILCRLDSAQPSVTVPPGFVSLSRRQSRTTHVRKLSMDLAVALFDKGESITRTCPIVERARTDETEYASLGRAFLDRFDIGVDYARHILILRGR